MKLKKRAKRSLKAVCVFQFQQTRQPRSAQTSGGSVCQEHKPAVAMAVRIGTACAAAAV